MVDLVIIPFKLSPEQAAEIGESILEDNEDLEAEIHPELIFLPNQVYNSEKIIDSEKLYDFLKTINQRPLLLVTSEPIMGYIPDAEISKKPGYVAGKASNNIGILTTYGTDQISQRVFQEVAQGLLK